MVRAVYVQVGEAAVAIEEFDAVVLVADLDPALAVQLDTRPLVKAEVVVVQVYTHLEGAGQVNAGGPFAFEVDPRVEVVTAVVNLNAVPHGRRAADGSSPAQRQVQAGAPKTNFLSVQYQ